MAIKVILTGATGMVGEGVLLECLQNDDVAEVLVVGRRHYDFKHPKLKECIVPDFFELEKFRSSLTDYDACFYCAGVSSVGMSEADYSRITFDTSLHFAKVLLNINPRMAFIFVTGQHTDSTETGKIMWARVKGKTENALMKLGFNEQYNFRPGFMKPLPKQKNVKWFFKPIIWVFPQLFPSKSLTLHQVGKAMIHATTKGFEKQVLEITDIKALANR